MADASRIARIDISLRTRAVRADSFDQILLVDSTIVLPGGARTMYVTDSDDLLDDVSLGITDASPLYKAVLAAFSQTPRPNSILIGRRGTSETPAVAMAAIRAENSNFYGFSDVAHASADVLLYAAWAEANSRLYATVLSDADSISNSTTGTAASLKNGNYQRTFWFYHADPLQFPEVGEMAKVFRKAAGTDDWANVALTGVATSALTETQSANVRAKNGNTFEDLSGIAITQGGKTAGGEWIDVIRGRDWLESDMTTRVFNNHIDRRIVYTNEGIQSQVQQVRASLDEAVRRQFLAPEEVLPSGKATNPSYIVTFPDAADVSTGDKASRTLTGIEFTARIAGAIHITEVSGALTLENLAT